MSAKERRAQRRLEMRVDELTGRMDHVQEVANNLLRENVDLSIALRSVGELLEEALSVLDRYTPKRQ